MNSLYVDAFVEPSDTITVSPQTPNVSLVKVGQVTLHFRPADLARLHAAIGEHLESLAGGTP